MALFNIMNALHPTAVLTPVDTDYFISYDVSTGVGKKCLVSALSTKVQADLHATADAKIYLNVQIPDVSTASSEWVVCPVAGTVTKIWSVINGTIATAPAVLTFKLATTAITGATISIADAGSAAGTVDSCIPTALNTVAAGEDIECLTSGASDNAIIAWLTIEITPT